jgi:TRAP-type mannitol/chloroaromatic compound transport system permease small subunit
MIRLVRTADAIKQVLEKMAFASGWLLVLLMFITITDVIGRKFGIPIPLTKFQEMEYYLHTVVFSMWMGYNYAINAHPRVDSYTENLGFHARAWLEFWGCLIFALPYMGLLVYFGWDFFWTSFFQNESSEHAVGLPWRWIVKAIFYLGNWFVLLGIVSVMLRLIAYLFGGVSQKDSGLDLGHVELEA